MNDDFDELPSDLERARIKELEAQLEVATTLAENRLASWSECQRVLRKERKAREEAELRLHEVSVLIATTEQRAEAAEAKLEKLQELAQAALYAQPGDFEITALRTALEETGK